MQKHAGLNDTERASDSVMVPDGHALSERVTLALKAAGFHVDQAAEVGAVPSAARVMYCTSLTSYEAGAADVPCILVGHDVPCAACKRALSMHANAWVPEPLIEVQLAITVRGLMRLTSPPPQLTQRLALDPYGCAVTIDSERVQLRRTEYRLFVYLAHRAGDWISQQELLRHVFEMGHSYETALVRVHVHSLRRALGDHASWLESARGYGYRLSPTLVAPAQPCAKPPASCWERQAQLR